MNQPLVSHQHLFFVVRYSVLVNEPSWNLAKDPTSQYRQRLFDPKRLRARLSLFSNLTLPSLAEQHGHDGLTLTLIVLTSEALPEEDWVSLRQALSTLPKNIRTEIVALPPTGRTIPTAVQESVTQILAADGLETVYATVRLDDDDALARNYSERMARFLNPVYAGMMVSFPKGYAGVVEIATNCLTDIRHYYAPKLALGLAHVAHWTPAEVDGPSEARNVFSFGGHKQVDRYIPVLLDASFPAFIRTLHSTNDSGSDNQDWVNELPMAGKEIIEWFPQSLFANCVLTRSGSKRNSFKQRDCEQSTAQLKICRKRRRAAERHLREREK